MKLQITCKNKYRKGFLIFEIMISFSLFIIFTIYSMSLSHTNIYLRQKGIDIFNKAKDNIIEIDSFIKSNNYSTSSPEFKSYFGNFSILYNFDQFDFIIPDLVNSIGRDTCYPRFSFDINNISFYSPNNLLQQGNNSMDIEVRNGFVYLTADSNDTTLPDLYIFDVNDLNNIKLVSSIKTGPGLGGIEIASHYIYALNLGTSYTLAVIDIQDRSSPSIVKKYKIPSPNASTTLPIPSSIFYRNGYVYIGTEKWSGNEFNIIDVTKPSDPVFLGGFEIDSIVEDIFVRGEFAYIGTPNQKQFRILNIKDPKNIHEVSSFSASGFATQEGKVVSFFEDHFLFGRTVGGFNVINNHEIFSFSTTSYPLTTQQLIPSVTRDIPGGVYGILYREPYVYLISQELGKEFQVWDSSLKNIVYTKNIGFFPRTMSCDNKNIYLASHNSNGFLIIKI